VPARKRRKPKLVDRYSNPLVRTFLAMSPTRCSRGSGPTPFDCPSLKVARIEEMLYGRSMLRRLYSPLDCEKCDSLWHTLVYDGSIEGWRRSKW